MNELEKLRLDIKEIDKEILRLFHDRQEVSKKVKEYKEKENLATFNREVEEKKLSSLKNDDEKTLLALLMVLSRLKQHESAKKTEIFETNLEFKLPNTFFELVRNLSVFSSPSVKVKEINIKEEKDLLNVKMSIYSKADLSIILETLKDTIH